jgi:hypothetical protein
MRWLGPAARAAATMLRDPVIGVLLLAGVAEILAGDPLLDWLILLAVAAALGWDRVRRPPPGPREPESQERSTGIGPAATAPAGAAGRPEQVDRSLPARPAPGWVIAGLLYAVVAGRLARFSWPAVVAVAGPGLAGMLHAWRTPRRPSVEPAPIRAGGAAAWSAVFVALALWELSALLLQPALTIDSPAHPTISVLLDPVLGSPPGRSVGFAVWLALGWFLARQ